MRYRFVVLVPVKPIERAKSRLAGIPLSTRGRLAVAFALDTITAALATPRVSEVVVVGDDPLIIEASGRLGCRSLPDRGGLNASLLAAAVQIAATDPSTVLVALCADLPALSAADLGSALASLSVDRPGFVSDHCSIGTTTYAARASQFDPRFGPRSRAAHLAAGADELETEAVGLRHDVDTLADLAALASLGLLGPHTSTCDALVDLRAGLAQ